MKFSLHKSRKEQRINTLHDEEYFSQLRSREYQRLDTAGHCYLDFTGGNLYASSQIVDHHNLLQEHVFGNPHSTNPTSQLATKLVEAARQKVLDFFNAKDYYCIFTPNATGALKIVGECYPFDEKSKLVMLADNHNSVNGIREYCANKTGVFEYAPIQYEDLQIDRERLEELLCKETHYSNKLFAYPAQSNVSGVKHSFDWIGYAQKRGWDVLLDAAAFVPTSNLNLTKYQPDFISVSFYKIFGYPTGLGCLLVRKDKFEKLHKPWFAGGTVTLASVQTRAHYLAKNHERFENGTINYLDIPAIKIGLDFIDEIGMERINKRVTTLANHLYFSLKQMRHESGLPQVRIFGPANRKHIGGTLIMNFFDANGKLIPFEEVEEKANTQMISIRSGCFCNPGVDEVNNCLSNEELSRYFTSRDKGDYYDMINYLGKMRGATRVSVGIATTTADLNTFIRFVETFKNITLN